MQTLGHFEVRIAEARHVETVRAGIDGDKFTIRRAFADVNGIGWIYLVPR